MSLRTPTDFLAISWSSASVRFPAPGISRSMTNSGMVTSLARYGSKYSSGSLECVAGVRDVANLNRCRFQKDRRMIRDSCTLVPWQKTELALASLVDDASLAGAACVWHHR